MPRKAKKITGKVWHFIDYQARFGSVKECKGKVPKYIKWYINSWEGAEADVIRAINHLRSDTKNKRDFIWFQGAVVELLTQATNTDLVYQGYLLNSRKSPATNAEIGLMLGVDGRKALSVLNKLSNAGFLEQVSVGTVDFFTNDLDNDSLQSSRNRAKGSANKGSKQGANPPPGAKNAEKPLKEKSAPSVPPKEKKCLSAFNENCGEGGGNVPTMLRIEDQAKGRNQVELIKDQLAAMVEGRQVPTASQQANVPTKADGGGVDTGSRPVAPHVDSETSQRSTIKLHEQRRYHDAPHRNNSTAMRLGEWVARVCGISELDVDGKVTEDWRRNVGSYASVWDKQLPVSEVEQGDIEKHVLNKSSEVRSGNKRPAWMSTVLRNACIDAKRKHRRQSKGNTG